MNSRKKLIVSTFSLGWWMYVGLSALGVITVSLIGNHLADEAARRSLIFWLSSFQLLFLILYKLNLRNVRADYNFFNELPCYLCNLSTIMCMIAAATGNVIMEAYCFTIGTMGAVLAYLMPDGPNQRIPAFSIKAYGFYGYHLQIPVTCLCFYTLHLYQPSYSHIIPVLVLSIGLMLMGHVINFLLRTSGLCPKANYMFTYQPDNPILEKLYKIMPVKALYLIPLVIPFGIACVIMIFFIQ